MIPGRVPDRRSAGTAAGMTAALLIAIVLGTPGLVLGQPGVVLGQPGAVGQSSGAGQASGAVQTGGAAIDSVPPLFASHAPLAVTLTANFGALVDDRQTSPDRPGLLTVPFGDGESRNVSTDVRTRGAFRLDPRNCAFPPLRLDVDGSEAEGTVLEGQDDLKFVSACRPGRESYEEMVLLEYLAYRTYAMVTEESFRVRLLDVTLIDTDGAFEPDRRTAFVIEEPDALAARLGATVFELEENRNLPPSAFEPIAATTQAVFQYMIGNSDWSEVAGHNVELLERRGVATAVPYDFDFSGLVDAPYATPPADLGLSDVTERLYRGWCANPFTVRTVLDRYRAVQDDVLRLWSDTPGLSEGTRARAARYLGEFFDAIETDERADRRFLRDCRRAEG